MWRRVIHHLTGTSYACYPTIPSCWNTESLSLKKHNLPSYGGQWIPSWRLCWRYLQIGNNEASWSPRRQPHRDLERAESRKWREWSATMLNMPFDGDRSAGVNNELEWRMYSTRETSVVNQCMLSESILLWHRKLHLHKARRHQTQAERWEVNPNIIFSAKAVGRRLSHCLLTALSCTVLSSALQEVPVHLKAQWSTFVLFYFDLVR